MKNKRNLIIIAAVVVVIIIALVAAKKTGKIGQAPGTDVAVDSVSVRTITETITANGKVQPETEVKISADVSGEIVELHVIEGQDVKEGQLLLKIKPDIYISALERVEAALNSSHSNLANAKARLAQVKAQFVQTDLSYKRNKQLFDQGAISKAEFENISAQFEVAKAEVEAATQSVKAAEYQVKSAEASLKEARENLQKTTIYAPVSGTVSRLNVEKGERVVGTIQMTGTEIMRIANLNLMEVKVDVNENDIINVSINDTALIEVDAYLGQKFKGLVREVANSANTTGLSADQVTNFEVKIRILPGSYKHLIPDN
ncbi:MAG TPA: efflux transporter periplasmic adaptor subunit, partial [Bacteroidales bacterium]|nr:efflux transporter periplasmic adaptor subunit [Bacteroidales bacterium]